MNTRIRQQETGKINIILQDDRDVQHPFRTTAHSEHDALQFIDHAFASFTGMQTLKAEIKEMYAIQLMEARRKEMGLAAPKQVLHMIFQGNPGTGKTTVARNLAALLPRLNILSKGQFIEAERADLVGEYIGQTAQKTRNLVQEALGGVLFIDEAYALARGGDKDFGREAIDTLVKQMEDHHREFMLILAGYPHEMQHFLHLNPGLKSRFAFHITFRDYTAEELVQIALQMAKEKDYQFSNQAVLKLKRHFELLQNRKPAHFANGRYVRNLVEQAIRRQSMRLLYVNSFTADDLLTIKSNDLKLNHPR